MNLPKLTRRSLPVTYRCKLKSVPCDDFREVPIVSAEAILRHFTTRNTLWVWFADGRWTAGQENLTDRTGRIVADGKRPAAVLAATIGPTPWDPHAVIDRRTVASDTVRRGRPQCGCLKDHLFGV